MEGDVDNSEVFLLHFELNILDQKIFVKRIKVPLVGALTITVK